MFRDYYRQGRVRMGSWSWGFGCSEPGADGPDSSLLSVTQACPWGPSVSPAGEHAGPSPVPRSAPVSGSPEATGELREGEASPAHIQLQGGLGVGGHDPGGHAEGHGVCEEGHLMQGLGGEWGLSGSPREPYQASGAPAPSLPALEPPAEP